MRITVGISLALLMVLGATRLAADDVVGDRFSFARPPAPESTVDPKNNRLDLVIERWSTDADRDQLIKTIADSGTEKLLDAFRSSPRLGTINWPGGLQYGVHYARRQARPDGGSDVLLVVDRPLWMWWDTKIGSTDYPYSVVHIRLDKDGKGEGRVSLNVPVTSDKTFGVALADMAKAPVVLTDVRRG
jgi:hypothetical protein